MESGECQECSSWEQSIYWNHFQSIHFCQILDSDFHSQLMIPRKFTDYARGKLQDKVTLRGPSGTTTWEVGLTTNGDMLFLRDGWTEFVNAFCLQQNDILIFKYNGNSCFSTLIFDRGSMCEKESSYFTKKCGHSRSRPNNRNQEKTSMKEVLEEFPQEHSHEEFELNPLKKLREDEDGQNPNSPKQHEIASDIPKLRDRRDPYIDIEEATEFGEHSHEEFDLNPSKKQRKHENGKNPYPTEHVIASDVPEMRDTRALYIDVEEAAELEEKPKNPQKSWSWEPVNLPSAVTEKEIKPPMKVPSTNVAENVSKTTMTIQQMEATLRMARKELTSDSFLAVMRPTSVYRVFYLNIPAAWINQHLAFKTQFVRLRTNEKTWPTKLLCRANGLRGGLTVGWKDFALDNCLKESDVCVFKLANNTPKHEPIILDVTIFRVPIAVNVLPPSSTS